MIYKNWKPIYKEILKDFNFQEEKDILAADILNKLLHKKENCTLGKLEELIFGKEIAVFGAGHSLKKSIFSYKKEYENKLKIAADGATSALIENDILPDIIVTDLDGKLLDQLKANLEGSILVIHAHGDNIEKIKEYVPKFRGNVLGTTQTDPRPYENLHNFGGFTDGDRASFLANNFNAKKITLFGFDFDGKIGKYSFLDNKDKNIKLKKLKWCEFLIDEIKNSGQNIQEI